MDIKMVKVTRCPSQYSGSDTISGFDGGSGASGVEIIESSATSSPSESSGKHRIRTIRLIRPSASSSHFSVGTTKLTPCTGTTTSNGGSTLRQGPFLGFSIRGGREHGTGFFISAIQNGSEAEQQGLKIGDQIIRINGFTVEDAIHKEVLQLISNHKHINLKVRHVGMVPVKEKQSDSLGWQIIDDSISIKRGSPTPRDIKISIVVTPRSKLDCGICKGPDWKPGIFIQFTKEGGIAHDVGLRPGDQILNCNNIDFNGISFNDAVHILKSSKQLDLTVRQGAGLELIAAESSGYNSSASSVTGDQSPSSADSKRLSIVKEETLELEDRLSQLDRSKAKKWNESKWNQGEPIRNCKPTIITLSGNETTIENNGPPEVCHAKFESNGSVPSPPSQPIKHTVIAQIHRTEEDCNEIKQFSKPSNEKPTNLVKNPLPMNGNEKSTNGVKNSLPTNGNMVPPPPPAPISLSNAICQELQRRTERKLQAHQNGNTEIKELRKVPPIESSIDPKKQHDILMDEFRKVHHKMFASSNNTENDTEDKKVESPISKPSDHPIPPPPPPQIKRSNTHNKPKAPPVPKKTYNEIPPCPVPDYESSNTMLYINNNNNSNSPQTNNEKPTKSILDTVEMDSLESFQLNNPSGPEPKPPSTYFNKPRHRLLSAQSSVSSATSFDSMVRNGTAAMQQKKRPVSVTFSEYPSGVSRRPPAKLGFLNGTKSCDYDERDGNQSITSRLASELSQTLLRANLKMNNNDTQETVNNLRNTSNNSVTINVNNSLVNGCPPPPPGPSQIQMQHHKPLVKSQSVNPISTTNIHNGLTNRLTIRISDENQ